MSTSIFKVMYGTSVVMVCVCVIGLLGQELMELQSKTEDVDCLPTLSVNDVERHAEHDLFVVRHKGCVYY